MKICILGGNISKYFNGETIGGAEKQVGLLAKEFAKRGHDVFIFESKIEKLKSPIERITFVKTWNSETGISGLRMIHRIKTLHKKVLKINPDVFYTRGTSLYAALLSISLRKNPTAFLWGLACIIDIEPIIKYRNIIKPSFHQYIYSRIIFHSAAKTLLKLADVVICQTVEQEKAVSRHCKDSIIASNIIENKIFQKNTITSDVPLIWVGKLTGEKGEKELFKLAEKISPVTINVAGHISENFLITETYQKIKNQNNIKLLGRLSPTELNQYYQCAKLLIHTGATEGFSNAFLEAWYNKTPVISLYENPNKLLSDNKLGCFCNGNIDNMANMISNYLNDPALLKVIGERAHNYVVKNHNAENIVNTIEFKLKQIVK